MTTNPELRVEGKGQERGELTFNTQLSHNCDKATFNFISYQCYNHFYYLSLHEYSIPLIITVNGGQNPPRKVKIREVAALLYKSPQGSNLSQIMYLRTER